MDLVDLKKIVVSFVDNSKINGMNFSFLQFVSNSFGCLHLKTISTDIEWPITSLLDYSIRDIVFFRKLPSKLSLC